MSASVYKDIEGGMNMSSVFGITSSNDNYFSSVLGTKSSSQADSSAIGSLLSSSSSLGDYSLIQSGAYKKLLNAYYTKKSSDSDSAASKTEKVNLSTANSDATALNNSVGKLMNIDITEENRESLKSSLKDVVEKYNSLIDSASDVDNTSVLRQALWMTQGTSALTKSLTDIGVTIGEGNKLVLDEEKFDKADLNYMKTLFTGKDSFMGKLSSRTNLIASAAQKAVTGNNSTSTYTNTADYSKTSTGHIIDELF